MKENEALQIKAKMGKGKKENTEWSEECWKTSGKQNGSNIIMAMGNSHSFFWEGKIKDNSWDEIKKKENWLALL